MTRIEPLQRTDWEAAMAVALDPVPDDSRDAHVAHCVSMLANGTLDPTAVRIARAGDGTILGVQVCVPLAGASCLFWLPAGSDDCAGALVRACLQQCCERGIKIAQAFVVPDEM